MPWTLDNIKKHLKSNNNITQKTILIINFKHVKNTTVKVAKQYLGNTLTIHLTVE